MLRHGREAPALIRGFEGQPAVPKRFGHTHMGPPLTASAVWKVERAWLILVLYGTVAAGQPPLHGIRTHFPDFPPLSAIVEELPFRHSGLSAWSAQL